VFSACNSSVGAVGCCEATGGVSVLLKDTSTCKLWREWGSNPLPLSCSRPHVCLCLTDWSQKPKTSKMWKLPQHKSGRVSLENTSRLMSAVHKYHRLQRLWNQMWCDFICQTISSSKVVNGVKSTTIPPLLGQHEAYTIYLFQIQGTRVETQHNLFVKNPSVELLDFFG